MSVKEHAAKIRAKMTWKNIAAFVSVATLRSLIGQGAVALIKSEVQTDILTGAKEVGAQVIKAGAAGLGGFQALNGLGRDED